MQERMQSETFVALVAIVASIVPIFAVPVVLSAAGFSVGGWGLWLAIAVVLAISAANVIIVVYGTRRQLYRRTRGVELAKERDGRVCPWCIGTPPLTAGEPRCCRRWSRMQSRDDDRAWDLDRLRLYWSQCETDPQLAAAMAMSTWSHGGAFRWSPGTMTFVLVLFSLPSLTGLGSPGWLVGLLSALFLLLCGYGVDLAIRSLTGYEETPPMCAACRYPRRGDSPTCPECGHDWSRPFSGVVQGRRVTQRDLLIAGLICAVIGGSVGFTARQWAPPLIAKWRSTASLIAEADVKAIGVAPIELWAELNRRRLSLEEERSLFDQLLDSRAGQRFFSGPPRVFMENYIAAGKLTPEQTRRIQRESFIATLTAPDQVKVGEPFEVLLAGKESESFLPPNFYIGIVVGDAWFEDAPTERWFSSPPRPLLALDLVELKTRPAETLPVVPATSATAGERVLVIRLWLMAIPPHVKRRAAEWRDDGTFEPPPEALWVEALELRHRITVAD